MNLGSPPEEVYRYWTKPDLYSRWMGCTVRLEPKAGGEYFVQMNEGLRGGGNVHRCQTPAPHGIHVGLGAWRRPGCPDRSVPDELLQPGKSQVQVHLEESHGGT